jgi:hypothetical protein
MRLIRIPKEQRDARKIRSGYAAGYKKGMEDGTKMLESARQYYEAEIRRLKNELDGKSYVKVFSTTTGTAIRYYTNDSTAGSLYVDTNI